MADDTSTKASTTDDPATTDDQLGEGGKKALQAERDARKALEDQVKALTTTQGSNQALMDGLREALGVKSGKTTEAELLTTLQEQMADMQRATLVGQVARANKITDPDQLAKIEAAPNEASMKVIAELLADRNTAAAASTPGTPRPDASQGGTAGGPGSKPDPKPGMGRLRQAYETTSN